MHVLIAFELLSTIAFGVSVHENMVSPQLSASPITHRKGIPRKTDATRHIHIFIEIQTCELYPSPFLGYFLTYKRLPFLFYYFPFGLSASTFRRLIRIQLTIERPLEKKQLGLK